MNDQIIILKKEYCEIHMVNLKRKREKHMAISKQAAL